MKKILVIISAIALMLITSGCMSNRIGDFTVLSTKNIDLNNPSGFKVVSGPRLIGEDIKAFGIPNIEEAVDKAIQSKPGCIGLANAALYYKTGFFTAGYRVEGDPIFPGK